MTVDRLYRLLDRAWEHLTCVRGVGFFCYDDKRRKEVCEPCAVRQDIEDAVNLRATQSDSSPAASEELPSTVASLLPGQQDPPDYDRLVAENAALRAEIRALTEERDHLAGLVEQLEYETRPLIEDIDVEGGVL